MSKPMKTRSPGRYLVFGRWGPSSPMVKRVLVSLSVPPWAGARVRAASAMVVSMASPVPVRGYRGDGRRDTQRLIVGRVDGRDHVTSAFRGDSPACAAFP